MRKLIYSLIFLFFLMSCNNDVIDDTTVSAEKDINNKVQYQPRLSFNTEVELQSFIEEIKLGNEEQIKTKSSSDFKSLYELEKEKFTSSLSDEQINDFLTDPDEPEFYFEDSVIFDDSYAKVLNNDREIQVGSEVYKYVVDGVYKVQEEDDYLLENTMLESQAKTKSLDSRITFYPASYTTVYESEGSENVELRNTRLSGPLKLKNNITIAQENIRDLNFKDKGDSNWLTSMWTSIWGKRVVAEKKFSGNRKMILTFYTQDYIIYKSIGTSAKMQKKKWFWWNNMKAEQICLGWEAIEIEQKTSNAAYPVQKTSIYNPLTQKVEIKETVNTPAFLRKNFPFVDKYLIFTVPVVDYDVTTYNINSVYASLVKKIPSSIKGLFPNDTKKGFGIATIPNAYTTRIIIDKKEEISNNVKTKDTKFYSNWFGGTYELGFSSSNGSISIKQFSFKTNNTNLKRGIVYGAVKYNGTWLAGRIIKDE